MVKEIKKLASTAEEIYLATDPDREGESISWHLAEAAQIDMERAKRVVFHEITAPAVAEAFANPREINDPSHVSYGFQRYPTCGHRHARCTHSDHPAERESGTMVI